jgi:hypothetical protein
MGVADEPLLVVVGFARLMQRTVLASVSRKKMSNAPFVSVSPLTKLVAPLSKTTYRPSALIETDPESPLPLLPFGALLTRLGLTAAIAIIVSPKTAAQYVRNAVANFLNFVFFIFFLFDPVVVDMCEAVI